MDGLKDGMKTDGTQDQDEVESGSCQDKAGDRRVNPAGLRGVRVDCQRFS